MDNTNQTIDPKVIERLMKLDRMRKDGGASEGEANNATEIMQRLMRDHNITMAALEMAGKSSDTEGGKRTKEQAKGRAGYKYQQELMSTIASVNFVYVTVRETWTGKKYAKSGYNLIGREVNVIAAQQTFEYLNSTIERLAREYVGGDSRMILSREAIAFKEGMAHRLCERLQTRHDEALEAQRKEAAAANAAARHPSAAPGTALVVVLEDVAQAEADANADFRHNREPGTTARQRKEREVEDAMRYQAYCALEAEMAGVKDPELCLPVATKAAEKAAEAFTIDAELRETLLRRALEIAMRWHTDKVDEAAKMAKETPKQKAAREEREARASHRYWSARDAEQAERNYRKGSRHFAAGHSAAGSVGLDKQVNHGAPSSAGRLT